MTNTQYCTTRTRQQIRDILESPSVSGWLKDALRSALDRDCVDAARDASTLASLLRSIQDDCLGRPA